MELAVGSYATKYTQSLNTDTSGVYPSRINDGTVAANIGLPSWGDMFSGNDLNENYWYINRRAWDNTFTTYVDKWGYAYARYTPAHYAVRPVFTLASSISIVSGSGTMADPYILNW